MRYNVSIALTLYLSTKPLLGRNPGGIFMAIYKKSYERKLLRSRFKSWYEFVRPRSKLTDKELRKIWFTSLDDDDSEDSIDSAEAVRPPVGGGEA